MYSVNFDLSAFVKRFETVATARRQLHLVVAKYAISSMAVQALCDASMGNHDLVGAKVCLNSDRAAGKLYPKRVKIALRRSTTELDAPLDPDLIESLVSRPLWAIDVSLCRQSTCFILLPVAMVDLFPPKVAITGRFDHLYPLLSLDA